MKSPKLRDQYWKNEYGVPKLFRIILIGAPIIFFLIYEEISSVKTFIFF